MHPLLQLALVLCLVAAMAAFVSARRSGQTPRAAVALSALLPIAATIALVSFAVRLHRTFGAWPTTIGTAGWPAELVAHAELAQFGFGVLFLLAFTLLPLVTVIFAAVPRCRPLQRCTGAFALGSAGCFLALALTPAAFQYWWWD
ncbi:MAG: hypothetical protein JNL08_03770 [Planctomycetes bacterium]|nr:hypothetical protein [Planctomycetota bacterium]